MKYFLTLLIAFAVCGAMFGVNILLQNICYKRKRFLLQGFCMPLVGLALAAVVICDLNHTIVYMIALRDDDGKLIDVTKDGDVDLSQFELVGGL